MAIETMFDGTEQAEIRVMRAEGYGFAKTASKYLVARRAENQLGMYKRSQIHDKQITSIKEIAVLFGVNPSSVREYLERYMSHDLFIERNELYRKAGQNQGGESNRSSKNRHILTKEEKRDGGKNGDKTANFKSSGSS